MDFQQGSKGRAKAITIHGSNEMKFQKVKQNENQQQSEIQKQNLVRQNNQEQNQNIQQQRGKFDLNLNNLNNFSSKKKIVNQNNQINSVSPNFNRGSGSNQKQFQGNPQLNTNNNSGQKQKNAINNYQSQQQVGGQTEYFVNKKSIKLGGNQGVLKMVKNNNHSISSPQQNSGLNLEKKNSSLEKKANQNQINQFNVSPSNIDRIRTETSQSNKRGGVRNEKKPTVQKIQNFFPRNFEKEQVNSIDTEIQKISFAFKKYECICMNFLQKEASLGINLNVEEYCQRLYKFLDTLNPNIKLFSIMKNMFQIPMNQLLYDLAQFKAESVQRNSETEQIEQVLEENKYLYNQLENLKSDNERLTFFIRNQNSQTKENKENSENSKESPLLKENLKLKKIAKKYKKQIQNIQEKEEKIMRLLYAIRKKGIDIEQIYNNDVMTPDTQSETNEIYQNQNQNYYENEEQYENQQRNNIGNKFNQQQQNQKNGYDIYNQKEGFYIEDSNEKKGENHFQKKQQNEDELEENILKTEINQEFEDDDEEIEYQNKFAELNQNNDQNQQNEDYDYYDEFNKIQNQIQIGKVDLKKNQIGLQPNSKNQDNSKNISKLKLDLSSIHQQNSQQEIEQNQNLLKGFHQEFMDRIEEFSESWRLAALKEKKF